MKTLVDLLKESVLIQAVLALTVTIAVVLMYVSQITIPSELLAVWSLIVGFYFGARVERAITQSRRKE